MSVSPFARATGRPLKILDATDFYSATASGGVKTYLHAKSAAFEKMGISHVMVVPGERTLRTLRTRLGRTALYRIRGPRVPMSPAYRVMLSARRFREVLERERPDVIEVGSPFIVPRLVRRGLAGRRVPLVGFYHADIVRTFAEPYVPSRSAAALREVASTSARRFVLDVYGRMDATVAASRSVADELTGLGVPNVHCIGLGVDLEVFHPNAAREPLDCARYGISPGTPVGVFMGRFCAEKRLDVLLEGHALIPPEDRPHLLLVGDGPHRERLERLAERQAGLTLLPCVQDRREVACLYAGADFYLACGPGETFGLSIAEAMACGLPVVAVNRGAAPDRGAGSGAGELYEHDHPASCAEALLRMARRGGRPEGRGRARAHAEVHFSWERTFRRLAGLYEDLARGGARNPVDGEPLPARAHG